RRADQAHGQIPARLELSAEQGRARVGRGGGAPHPIVGALGPALDRVPAGLGRGLRRGLLRRGRRLGRRRPDALLSRAASGRLARREPLLEGRLDARLRRAGRGRLRAGRGALGDAGALRRDGFGPGRDAGLAPRRGGVLLRLRRLVAGGGLLLPRRLGAVLGLRRALALGARLLAGRVRLLERLGGLLGGQLLRRALQRARPLLGARRHSLGRRRLVRGRGG